MKTTIAIDNALLRIARARAVEQGVSVDELVERALRAGLALGRQPAAPGDGPGAPQALRLVQGGKARSEGASRLFDDSEVERLLTSMVASATPSR